MGSFYVQNSGMSTADQNIVQFESFHKPKEKKISQQNRLWSVHNSVQTDTNGELSKFDGSPVAHVFVITNTSGNTSIVDKHMKMLANGVG